MKKMLCLMLALCVGFSSCTALAASKATQDKIDQVKQEKSEAEEEKKKTEQEQNKLNNAKSEMENYLKELDSQTKSLNEQVAELDQQITDKENQVSSIEGQIEEAQADLDKQYEDMKTRIQYMYENDQTAIQSIITAALTGGLTGLLNQVEYTVSVNQYDRNMLENYKASKADLDDQYAKLQDEQEALELLKTETEKKKQQVAEQQAATGSKLSEYEKLLAQKEGEITDMAELIKEKTELLNQLIAKAAQEEAAARIQAAQQAAASMNTTGNIQQADSGISGGSISLSEYEIMMLATIIYCEAGNQGTDGQLAVGYVIMNRIRSSRFPNTLEGVLRQSKQFEPVGSGRFDLVLKAEQDDDIPNIVTQSCWNAARTVVNGTSNVGESLFFRTWAPVPSLVTNLQNGGVPYWIIKDHIFYYYWTSYTTGSSSNSNSSNSGKNQTDDDEEDEEKEEDTKKDEKDQEETTPSTDTSGDHSSSDNSSQDNSGSNTTDTPSQMPDNSGTTSGDTGTDASTTPSGSDQNNGQSGDNTGDTGNSGTGETQTESGSDNSSGTTQ